MKKKLIQKYKKAMDLSQTKYANNITLLKKEASKVKNKLQLFKDKLKLNKQELIKMTNSYNSNNERNKVLTEQLNQSKDRIKLLTKQSASSPSINSLTASKSRIKKLEKIMEDKDQDFQALLKEYNKIMKENDVLNKKVAKGEFNPKTTR